MSDPIVPTSVAPEAPSSASTRAGLPVHGMVGAVSGYAKALLDEDQEVAELRRRAGDPNPLVREEALKDERVPVDVLEACATDPAPEVRAIVAQHPSTPESVLAILSRDQDFRIR